MLTPSTRATIRPRALSTSALPRFQTRSLFGWKLNCRSYDSHLDPLYPRFIRHRTLKTRAKLLKALRRREHFNRDAEAKPFLDQKHVRYASHWDGTDRPRSSRYSNNEDRQGRNDENGEGYELSEREKAWKKQMEAMRKRVEADPYEAVFGKRFEPFWNSSLVPQWMREELGIAPKESEKPVDNDARGEKGTTIRQSNKMSEKSSQANTESPAPKQTQPSEPPVSRGATAYEYDPVSGRMVPIERPPAATSPQTQAKQADTSAHVTWKPVVAKSRFPTPPTNSKSEKTDIPVQTFKPVKPASSAGQTGVSVKSNKTCERPIAGQASAPRRKSNDVDDLTAGDVRASMGGSKRTLSKQEEVEQDWISEQQALKQQIRDWDNSVTKLKNQVAGIADEVSAVELGRRLPTSLDRHTNTPKSTEKAQPLQPAVQRMQNKEQPEPADPDDAAAHESTEPTPKHVFIPKDWSKQADILQSDRVKRTTESRPRPTMRWLEDMEARKAQFMTEKAASDAEVSTQHAEQNSKLENANAKLQAEVASQKLAMSEQQNRFVSKIRSLRGELETAYKQSSVHADAFRDRINTLNQELSVAQNTSNTVSVKAIKERYSERIRGLQKELETAYKQSSVHADEFTRHIKALEADLQNLTKAAGGTSNSKPTSAETNAKKMQGEGDFSPDVAKFANSDMWYKQPSSPPQPSTQDVAKAVQKTHEKELVAEVKSIYEDAYGKIDEQHVQPREAALEDALAKHDKRTDYAFKEDGLESELSRKSKVTTSDASEAPERAAYRFKGDTLETELTRDAQAVKSEEPEYAYKKDYLESELSQQGHAKAATNDDYTYKDDGLEAQLTQQSSAKDSQPPEKKFAYKDELATTDDVASSRNQAVQDHQMELRSKRLEELKLLEGQNERRLAIARGLLSDPVMGTSKLSSKRFVPDGLEADLKSQAKPTSSQSSERFKSDGLETELRQQGSAAAAAPVSHQGRRSKPAGLEAELKRLANEQPEYASDRYEAEAAKASSTPNKIGKMEKTMASSLGSELNMSTSSENPGKTGVQWQHPPLYKVVAYDSGNDRFSTATTTAWDYSVHEAPISIAQALSQLYQPARWTQHFALLQREGYQVVDAREDVLVLKKVQDASKHTETPTFLPASKPSESQNPINPVDGTSRSNNEVRPVTGDYANPTGYVNLDLLEELSAKTPSSSMTNAADRSTAAASSDEGDLDAEYQSFPRVTRQEPVFSGQMRASEAKRRANREAAAGQQSFQDTPKPKPRSLALWMLGVGATVSGVMYVTGSVAEKAKEAKKERELRELGAAKSGGDSRWRLDEGQWKK